MMMHDTDKAQRIVVVNKIIDWNKNLYALI